MHDGVATPDRTHIARQKYLTFHVGGECFGIGIMAVQEIIKVMPITKMPQAPSCMRGVINLRGKVIPIVDMHLRFALEQVPDTERTCIIVVESSSVGGSVGMVVDEVSEVLDMQEESHERPPVFSGSQEKSFVSSIAKIGQRIVLILDLESTLSFIREGGLDLANLKI